MDVIRLFFFINFIHKQNRKIVFLREKIPLNLRNDNEDFNRKKKSDKQFLFLDQIPMMVVQAGYFRITKSTMNEISISNKKFKPTKRKKSKEEEKYKKKLSTE